MYHNNIYTVSLWISQYTWRKINYELRHIEHIYWYQKLQRCYASICENAIFQKIFIINLVLADLLLSLAAIQRGLGLVSHKLFIGGPRESWYCVSYAFLMNFIGSVFSLLVIYNFYTQLFTYTFYTCSIYHLICHYKVFVIILIGDIFISLQKSLTLIVLNCIHYTIVNCWYTIAIYTTVIIAKVREVRENIKRNRLIWRIIQLWCFHHCHIVISHNSILERN